MGQAVREVSYENGSWERKSKQQAGVTRQRVERREWKVEKKASRGRQQGKQEGLEKSGAAGGRDSDSHGTNTLFPPADLSYFTDEF